MLPSESATAGLGGALLFLRDLERAPHGLELRVDGHDLEVAVAALALDVAHPAAALAVAREVRRRLGVLVVVVRHDGDERVRELGVLRRDAQGLEDELLAVGLGDARRDHDVLAVLRDVRERRPTRVLLHRAQRLVLVQERHDEVAAVARREHERAVVGSA